MDVVVPELELFEPEDDDVAWVVEVAFEVSESFSVSKGVYRCPSLSCCCFCVAAGPISKSLRRAPQAANESAIPIPSNFLTPNICYLPCVLIVYATAFATH